jgi:hypothetical protein
VDLRFYIDPETGEPHIWEHGISENEVEQVLCAPIEDRAGREGTRIALGQSASGRYLRIVYVLDPTADSAFVITAYELGQKAKQALRRRRRRRR